MFSCAKSCLIWPAGASSRWSLSFSHNTISIRALSCFLAQWDVPGSATTYSGLKFGIGHFPRETVLCPVLNTGKILWKQTVFRCSKERRGGKRREKERHIQHLSMANFPKVGRNLLWSVSQSGIILSPLHKWPQVVFAQSL